MMKYLFILLLFPLHSLATNYYWSSSGSNSNNGLSPAAPFQTLAKFQTMVNNGTVHSSDSCLFKCNEIFSGEVIIQNTRGGSAQNGINVGKYGTGAWPKFLYAGSGSTAEDRLTLLFIGVDNWTFQNIHLTDTDHTNDKKTGAHCGFPLYLGSIGEAPCNNWIIQNDSIDYCGMGLVWFGNFTTVRYVYMNNFKDLKNNGNVNDYGANPCTLLDANDSYVHDNYIKDGWAASDEFGYNGGFAEMFGSCKRNRFERNTIIDCNGISEFGANGGASLSDSNYYVYNPTTNCGAWFYANIGGIFATQVANTFIYQMVFVEQNGICRFAGSNLGAGLSGAALAAALASPDTRGMGYNTNPSATFLWISKNNVFQCSTPMAVFQSGTTKTSHSYTYYKLSGGSVPNVTLGGTEASGSAALFLDSSPSNAADWNFRPIVSSPIWNTGQQVTGFTTDFSGRPISNNMGLFGPSLAANQTTLPFYVPNGSGGFNRVIKVQ